MRNRLRLIAAGCALVFALPAFPAATVVIQNNDAPGVGFNDATVVAQVGGNTGTTLGQQRLNVFQYAANIWGATITSSVTIVVAATWEPLTCTATGAVLGSAGAISVVRDFTGAPKTATWFPVALANKYLGIDAIPASADIRARFNVNLGNPGCLTGVPFYLGLDANHGAAVDLSAVLLHELGHGLGFQTFTNGTSGAQIDDGTGGKPSIWDWFLMNNSTGKIWAQMTDPERAASAINTGHLVWSGGNAVNAVPLVLNAGTPVLTVSAPATLAGAYQVGTASFGPALNSPGVTGEVMPVVDQPAQTGPGCDPFNAVNVAAVNGKIAMIDRGTCGFTVKAKNAQNAGAIGVIIADNVAGGPPPGLGGADPTVTIPAVRITLSDANLLKAVLAKRTRLHSGVFANIGINLAIRSGADAANRPMMYSPNPFQGGSSVSHYDITMTPNQLMEPAINADLTHSVNLPKDLTFRLFLDIGW